MSRRRPITIILLVLLQGAPLAAMAQQASLPASRASSPEPDPMVGMEHGRMPGMAMSAAVDTAASMPVSTATGETPAPTHSDVQHDAMPAMTSGAAAPAGPAIMPMGRMQGGRAPSTARNPDYSDGVDRGPMTGMDMADNAPLGMLRIDQLEAFHGRDANGQAWDVQGWYGRDLDKLWLRSEGERSAGRLGEADLQVLWSHAVATFWDRQLGVRQDFGEGPGRSWLAFGVQGLAPYWFELEATAYLGASGRSAARLRTDYDLLFTQRLILQPEFEANLYGRNDPARYIGRGLSDVQFSLRLRYEVHRQFAPYVGVNWIRRIGTTADYARREGRPVLDRRFVAGVRIWF